MALGILKKPTRRQFLFLFGGAAATVVGGVYVSGSKFLDKDIPFFDVKSPPAGKTMFVVFTGAPESMNVSYAFARDNPDKIQGMLVLGAPEYEKAQRRHSIRKRLNPVPVHFLPTMNTADDAEQAMPWLKQHGVKNIIFVATDSGHEQRAYELIKPLLDDGCQIFRLKRPAVWYRAKRNLWERLKLGSTRLHLVKSIGKYQIPGI